MADIVAFSVRSVSSVAWVSSVFHYVKGIDRDAAFMSAVSLSSAIASHYESGAISFLRSPVKSAA